MKKLRLFALLVCPMLLLHTNVAAAQEVKIENVTFQQVLDRLFGTTGNAGLLDGNNRFELKAEHVALTRDQARTFFVPTKENTSDIADLIAAAQEARGELKVEGLMDGSPFEFKLSGRQIKLEGLDLTRAQLDSLVDQLKGISGLREAKIESMVDGRLIEVKLENRAERVKVEDREHHGDREDDNEKEGVRERETARVRERELARIRERELERIRERETARVRERELERIRERRIEEREKMERREKIERLEKVEPQRVERVERVERPESRVPPKP